MRVWDQFLTERDREQVSKIGAGARIGFGSRAALLMIDHCKYALGDERLPLLDAVDKYPLSFGLEGWNAVERTKELLDICRKEHVPVLYTTPFGRGPGSPSAPPVLVDSSLISDSEDEKWEVMPALAPIEGEIVLRKAGASAFAGTPLVPILQQARIDTLLVTGNSTSGCVRATVVDAAFHRFRTIVVEECVYDRTEASHAMSLFDMDHKYADVMGIREVLDWLQGPSDLK
jgi:maleamate amidohydrolase